MPETRLICPVTPVMTPQFCAVQFLTGAVPEGAVPAGAVRAGGVPAGGVLLLLEVIGEAFNPPTPVAADKRPAVAALRYFVADVGRAGRAGVITRDLHLYVACAAACGLPGKTSTT